METTGRTEDFLENLAAIEPVYHSEFGDVCRLYLRGGEEILDRRSIRSVKRAITRAKGLNQAYLRELCGDEIGRQLSLPLPLSANLVLVPLKMRQPFTNNDSAYGFVNLRDLKKVTSAAKGGALVQLNSGHTLTILGSRDTALIHLGEGTLLRQHFVQKVWEISDHWGAG
jgi:hypothetical protein